MNQVLFHALLSALRNTFQPTGLVPPLEMQVQSVLYQLTSAIEIGHNEEVSQFLKGTHGVYRMANDLTQDLSDPVDFSFPEILDNDLSVEHLGFSHIYHRCFKDSKFPAQFTWQCRGPKNAWFADQVFDVENHWFKTELEIDFRWSSLEKVSFSNQYVEVARTAYADWLKLNQVEFHKKLPVEEAFHDIVTEIMRGKQYSFAVDDYNYSKTPVVETTIETQEGPVAIKAFLKSVVNYGYITTDNFSVGVDLSTYSSERTLIERGVEKIKGTYFALNPDHTKAIATDLVSQLVLVEPAPSKD